MPKEVPPVVIEEAIQEAPADSDNVRFMLSEVEFVGASLYPEYRLRGLSAGLTDREVSLADLYELAGAITRLYRSDGYILSKAIVPAQEIEDGRVQIRIIEGFISHVTIESDDFRLVRLLEMHALEIEWAKPITADVLERHLLLIRDLPGVSANAVLRPSDTVTGASELVLQVETAPIQAFAQVNNRGTRIAGPYQGDVGVTFNSLLGLHEQFGARAITTFNDELVLLQGTYRQVLNRTGTSANGSFTYADTNSGGTLEDFGLEGGFHRLDDFGGPTDHPIPTAEPQAQSRVRLGRQR